MSLLLESILGSLKRAPVLAGLVVLLIGLGVGISVPMATVYHHLTADPIEGKGNRLYFVQLDNWREEEPFWRPDFSPDAITYQDAMAIRQSDIPSRQAPMFLASTTVEIESNEAIRPIKLDTRLTGRDFFEMFESPFLHGGPWSNDDERDRRQVAVISKALSLRLFGTEDSVGEQLFVDNRSFAVVGVLDDWQLTPRFYDTNDAFGTVEHLYLPFDVLFSEGIQPVYWRAPYGLSAPLTASTYESQFRNSEVIFVQYWAELDTPTQFAEYQDFLSQHVSTQKALGRFPRPLDVRLSNPTEWMETSAARSNIRSGVVSLLIVMLLFFGVCLINSVSLLLTKFLRFRNRVGVLRALGSSRKFVFAQHLVEVTSLAALGGVLGIAISYFTLDAATSLFRRETSTVNGLLAASGFEEFWTLDGYMLFSAFALSLVGGLLAGLYPAWKICRQPPAQALNAL